MCCPSLHPFQSGGAERQQGRAHFCSPWQQSQLTTAPCGVWQPGCCPRPSHQYLGGSLGLPMNIPDDTHQRNSEQNHPNKFSEWFLGSSDTRKKTAQSARTLKRSPSKAWKTGHLPVLRNSSISDFFPSCVMRNLRCLAFSLWKKSGHILRITYLSGYTREIRTIWVLFLLCLP